MTSDLLFRARVALFQAFLRETGRDGILLSRVDNFAAATGGLRNYINAYSDLGANSLAITKDGEAWYVGNNIELPRLRDEELGALAAGYHDYLWFESDAATCVKQHFTGTWCSDTGALGDNVNSALAPMRTLLTPLELDRYRALGRLGAEAMEAALEGIEPGTQEDDIAAALVIEGHKRHCHVPVFLVASDDRIAQYRHPLPCSGKAVNRYVMVVGCFQREGLVVSLTRMKKVADLPEEIESRYARICAVDALVQEATQPGRTLGEAFSDLRAAYAAQGFDAHEWHHHHQGGLTGYAGRTAKGMPGSAVPCLDTFWSGKASEILGREMPFGAAFAWNPSGPGVKSEDTFLLHPDGRREIVSATPVLPHVDLATLLGRHTEATKSAMAH
jgi:antitoxin VapB